MSTNNSNRSTPEDDSELDWRPLSRSCKKLAQPSFKPHAEKASKDRRVKKKKNKERVEVLGDGDCSNVFHNEQDPGPSSLGEFLEDDLNNFVFSSQNSGALLMDLLDGVNLTQLFPDTPNPSSSTSELSGDSHNSGPCPSELSGNQTSGPCPSELSGNQTSSPCPSGLSGDSHNSGPCPSELTGNSHNSGPSSVKKEKKHRNGKTTNAAVTSDKTPLEAGVVNQHSTSTNQTTTQDADTDGPGVVDQRSTNQTTTQDADTDGPGVVDQHSTNQITTQDADTDGPGVVDQHSTNQTTTQDADTDEPTFVMEIVPSNCTQPQKKRKHRSKNISNTDTVCPLEDVPSNATHSRRKQTKVKNTVSADFVSPSEVVLSDSNHPQKKPKKHKVKKTQSTDFVFPQEVVPSDSNNPKKKHKKHGRVTISSDVADDYISQKTVKSNCSHPTNKCEKWGMETKSTVVAGDMSLGVVSPISLPRKKRKKSKHSDVKITNDASDKTPVEAGDQHLSKHQMSTEDGENVCPMSADNVSVNFTPVKKRKKRRHRDKETVIDQDADVVFDRETDVDVDHESDLDHSVCNQLVKHSVKKRKTRDSHTEDSTSLQSPSDCQTPLSPKTKRGGSAEMHSTGLSDDQVDCAPARKNKRKKKNKRNPNLSRVMVCGCIAFVMLPI